MLLQSRRQTTKGKYLNWFHPTITMTEKYKKFSFSGTSSLNRDTEVKAPAPLAASEANCHRLVQYSSPDTWRNKNQPTKETKIHGADFCFRSWSLLDSQQFSEALN
jgi:hypothetical protein